MNATASDIKWNLYRVRAPDLWTDFGATGERQTGPSSWQSAGVAVVDNGGDYRLGFPAPNWQFFSALPSNPANFTGDGIPSYLGQHGTSVAGVVAAEPDGHLTAGVAPRASIKVYKAIPDGGTTDWTFIVSALNEVFIGGHSVVNMSFANCGKTPPSTVAAAISALASRTPSDAGFPGHGISMVAGAGNGVYQPCGGIAVGYPAAYEEVIAVAAIDVNDQHFNGYSVGPQVELSASGVCLDLVDVGGGLRSCVSGTSYATPHVAGLIAAIRALNNNWSASYVRQRLQETAIKIPGQALPKDNRYGHGVVNAYAVLVPLPPPPFQVTIDGPLTVGPLNHHCSEWIALAISGQPPFTYEWSGLFSSTQASVTGTVPTSGGDLSVYLVDSQGAHGFAQLFITYDSDNEDACV